MSAERSTVVVAAQNGASAPAVPDSRQEVAAARLVRARALVTGEQPADIAASIAGQCGSSKVRAYRLAQGIALADVVAQVRARYEADGRRVPRFSETLLSAYEGGQKRPGPEYLHYLCAVYQADPADLGFEGRCLCGASHRPRPGPRQAGPAVGRSRAPIPDPAEPPAVRSARGPAGPGSVVPEAGAVPGRGAGRQGSAVPEAGAVPGRGAGRQGSAVPEAGAAPGRGAGRQGSAVPEAGAGPVWSAPVAAGLERAVPAVSPGYRVDAPSGPALAIVAGGSLPGPAEPASAAGPRTPVRQDDDDDDDQLRRVLIRQMTVAGCRVDSRFLGAVDRIRRRMDEALLGGTVSASIIDTWEQSTVGYGRQYMTVPPLRLLCDVLLDLGDVRRMCEERQPLEFSERLCRLACQLAGLAGISMLDIGDHRLARSFFRTARTAADETGDRQLRAWVAAREALVPLYYGDPGEAAALAGSGTDLAGHLCVAAVMAPVIEARAQARLASPSCHGRRAALSRARAALDRAADAIADLPSEQASDTALGYTERQLYFHAGDALVLLGDWQGAYRAFSQAAQLYPVAEVLDCALVALGQARCLLESDEPVQALAVARDTVLGLPPEHRTDVVQQVARMLGQAATVRHPALPALSEYREALAPT